MVAWATKNNPESPVPFFLSLSGALYTSLYASEDISFQIIAEAGGTTVRPKERLPQGVGAFGCRQKLDLPSLPHQP